MDRLTATAERVIGVMLSILIAAFVVNAVGTITGAFAYPFPAEMVALWTNILGATTAVWGIGWFGQFCQKVEEKLFEKEKTHPVPLGKELIVDAEIIEKVSQSAETVAIEAAKFDKRTEALNVLYPIDCEVPLSGENLK